MPAIGITGGISTGKSTFCQCVREILPEARFFDADTAAHQLVDLDPQVKKELLAGFGAEVFSGKGDLNRKRLRAIIFQDAAKKSALEKILHPRIRRQWSVEAERHRNSPDFFFADIPLLYETGGETLCDRVVVVACSPGIQVLRLLQRGSNGTGHMPSQGFGMASRSASRTDSSRGEPVGTETESGDPATSLRDVTAAEIEAMFKSQMPLEEKIKKADHVVWNNGARSVLKDQAEKLVERWRQEKWTKA
jgi:dephospho-CoA kinase